jgi:hypothetical protein
MNRIAIYVEGGGDGAAGKQLLRQGFNQFFRTLKEAAEQKGVKFVVIACGGRHEAFLGFRRTASQDVSTIYPVLLVDSEDLVAKLPTEHLKDRDQWNLSFAINDQVHLMVTTMEAWIVADKQALSHFYGQGFLPNALPNANNLEDVEKRRLSKSLDLATKDTKKGKYHKIQHASELLARIDPQIARQRCPACLRLFDEIGAVIGKLP